MKTPGLSKSKASAPLLGAHMSITGGTPRAVERAKSVKANVMQIFVNDSKRQLGSRVDRHDHIGKGHIGRAGFAWFLCDPRLTRVPKILETPKGKDLKEDRRNLRLLRRLHRQGAPRGG